MPSLNLKNGVFDGMTRADLEAILDQLDASGRKLVVHFHGGLVNRARGTATAERLHAVYEQAGAFPLFVVWQSGLGETVAHNLGEIQAEKIFRRLLAVTLQFAVGKAGEKDETRGLTVEVPSLNAVYGEAINSEGEPYTRLPQRATPLSETQLKQVAGTLRADAVIQEESAKIANGLQAPQSEDVGSTRGARVVGSTHTHMSDEVLREIRAERTPDGARGAVLTLRIVKGGIATVTRVLSRLHDGRAHGIYPTAVEELLRELYLTNAGGLVWDAMKRDTSDAFGEDPDRHGGTALLEALARRTPSATPVLVGHSTGAVYICHLLAHAHELLPRDRTFDVVLLAPACDFALMRDTFERFGERIGRLRIFCMKDEAEARDQLVPVVYPRSLLYFVSGALERDADWPLLGMQRYYADAPPYAGERFPEIAAVRTAIAAKPDSQVWSIASGADGLSSAAEHHGAFDDDAATLASVQRFIGAA